MSDGVAAELLAHFGIARPRSDYARKHPFGRKVQVIRIFDEAIAYCVRSLAAGYIGLGFSQEVGDLLATQRADLPGAQQDYWAFAHEMKAHDRVLIIAHHFPFALATVSGPYNYIREHVPELGIWFRHFRPVSDVRYYADYSTNVRSWEQFTMTDTISPLCDRASKSYRLIAAWSADA